MYTLLLDLQFAIRQVRRSPGFTATAVRILALGISANVIVFGVLQAVILQPLDIPHVEGAVTFAPHAAGYPVFSYPEVRDVRDDSTVFSAVAAEAMEVFGLEVNGATKPVWGSEVSGQYFAAIGIQPFLGRLLQPSDDDHPQASEAAVISWPAWKSQFDADPNIVGKAVRINKHPYTIVGVGPEGFYGTQEFMEGTFGLASYTVSKRMRELSIRVALGAQGKQILSAALGRLLILIGAGSAIGMGLGVATGELLSHIVYQASAQDPVVLAAVLLTVLVTGSLAIAGPDARTVTAI